MDNAENVAAAMLTTQRVLALALMQDKSSTEVDEAIGAALIVVERAEDGDEHAAELVNAAVEGVNQLLADIVKRRQQ